MNGHPLWYSPVTDKYFKMSNHKREKVKQGFKRISQKKRIEFCGS
jgi:hypothetical protein